MWLCTRDVPLPCVANSLGVTPQAQRRPLVIAFTKVDIELRPTLTEVSLTFVFRTPPRRHGLLILPPTSRWLSFHPVVLCRLQHSLAGVSIQQVTAVISFATNTTSR